MEELFVIIYKRPVPSKFREKNNGTFKRQQNKAHQTIAGCKPENFVSMKLCMRNTAPKLLLIILKFNVTFINKLHGIPKEDVDFQSLV